MKNLTLLPIDKEKAWQNVEKEEKHIEQYKEKYGEKWWTFYAKDNGFTHNYDTDMKIVNTSIYKKRPIIIHDNPEHFEKLSSLWEKRIKELFGENCDRITFYITSNINPKNALLEDAFKTGKWEELPDELQEEYKKIKAENRNLNFP